MTYSRGWGVISFQASSSGVLSERGTNGNEGLISYLNRFRFKIVFRELNATSTATATKTPQNNRFNEQRQTLCTCVLNFGTFLCRCRQNNKVK